MAPDDFLADVAAVFAKDANGASFGSGRLIAPGLILTAGHVVDYPTRAAAMLRGWKVRLVKERLTDGAWSGEAHPAELIWRGFGELDLALLRLVGAPPLTPHLKPLFSILDTTDAIEDLDAAGFPEAWSDENDAIRDYRLAGQLRIPAAKGPYGWRVSPADKPDDPRGWQGMSGAAVCKIHDDVLYLFGVVQQVPAHFSGGLLEVARLSAAFGEAVFCDKLHASLGHVPPLSRWQVPPVRRSAVSSGTNIKRYTVLHPKYGLIGRSAEKMAICSALLDCTSNVAILVRGGPGIGKTTLTQAVANDPALLSRFSRKSRYFVPLEAAQTAAAMREMILTALGCDINKAFEDAIAEREITRTLLILDNLETPWSPIDQRELTEETLSQLAAVPNLDILASIRGALNVAGIEWTLTCSLAGLDNETSKRLFRRVSEKDFPNDPFLDLFIEALGGIPLAIVLVAIQALAIELQELWDAWDKIGGDLAVDRDYAPSPTHSLPYSIELSLNRCRDMKEPMRLFRVLGQLPAGLSRLDLAGLDFKDVDFPHGPLLRAGLCYQRDQRINLLPPIRDHADRKYPLDDRSVVFKYFLELAITKQYAENPGSSETLGRIAPEVANIASAISHAASNEFRHLRCLAVDAAAPFGSFLLFSGLGEMAPFMLLAEACERDGDSHGQAACLLPVAERHRLRSRYADAIVLYERVRSLISGSDLRREAICVWGLAEIGRLIGDRPQGDLKRDFERSLSLYEQANDKKGFIIGLLGLATTYEANATKQKQLFTRGLEISREIGSSYHESLCLGNLAKVAYREGNSDERRRLTEAAHEVHPSIDLKTDLAIIEIDAGNLEKARALAYDSVRLSREDDYPLGEKTSLTILAFLMKALAYCLPEDRQTPQSGVSWLMRRAFALLNSALTISRRIRDAGGILHIEVEIGKLDNVVKLPEALSSDEVAKLRALQAECATRLDVLPESLLGSNIAVAWKEIVDLDPNDLAAIKAQRGYGRD